MAGVLSDDIVRCTVCRLQINVHFRSSFAAHPKLGVVMCKRCLKFLLSGNWKKDENGADEYCTWCGQGGGVFICDTCGERAFCKNCLRRNFSRTYVASVAEQNWACFICDPAPLEQLREQCRQIFSQKTSKRPPGKSTASSVRTPARKLSAGSDEEETIETTTTVPQASTSTSTPTTANGKMVTLNRLLHRTLSWSEDFHEIIDGLQTELLKKIESDEIDVDQKQDAAADILNGLKESIECLKNFHDAMESSLTGRVCIRVGTDEDDGSPLFAWVPERAKEATGEQSNSGRRSDGNFTRKRRLELEENGRKKRRLCSEEDELQDSPTTDDGDNGVSEMTEVKKERIDDEQDEASREEESEEHPISATTDTAENGCISPPTTCHQLSPMQAHLIELAHLGLRRKTLREVMDDDSQNPMADDSQNPMVEATLEEDTETKTSEETLEEGPEKPTMELTASRENVEARNSPGGCENDDYQCTSPTSLASSGEFVDAYGSPMKSLGQHEDMDQSERRNEEKDEIIGDSHERPTSSSAGIVDDRDELTKTGDDIEPILANSESRSSNSPIGRPENHDRSARDAVMTALAADSSDSDSDDSTDSDHDEDACSVGKEPSPKMDTATLEENALPAESVASSPIMEDDIIDSPISPEAIVTVTEKPEEAETSTEAEVGSDPAVETAIECMNNVLSQEHSVQSEADFDPTLEAAIQSLKNAMSQRSSKRKEPSVDEGPSTAKKLKRKRKEDDENSIDSDGTKSDSNDEKGADDDASVHDYEAAIEMEESTLLTEPKPETSEESARKLVMGMLADDSSSSSEDENDDDPENMPKKKLPIHAPRVDASDQSVVDLTSDSDEDQEKEEVSKEQMRRLRLLRRRLVGPEKESDTESPSNNTRAKRGLRNKRFIILSSSDEEHDDSSPERLYESASSSGEEGSSDPDPDSDSAEEKEKAVSSIVKNEPLSQSSGVPGSPAKGSFRKNIRPVMTGSQSTLEAQAAERDRRRRIAELEKTVSTSVVHLDDNLPLVAPVVLDKDAEPVIQVNPTLLSYLKPHQVEGVKFLYRATIESVKQKENPPGGCILAHCMGLGKTLQVISFLHTVLRHPSLGLRTALVVAPLNVVLNWKAEFVKWLKECPPLEVRELASVSSQSGRRLDVLEEWHRNGGVLIMGYRLFKSLAECKTQKNDDVKERFARCLLDPGPDIVVCDEGHVLKNEKTGINLWMNRVKTKRRICLTGTPLQNNLSEYHCMVQFVKPALLGNIREFRNQFENPIKNGQCVDSTPRDVRLMKQRAHVLHSILEGSVHRMDYSVLTSVLPPRHEFILMIRLSEKQMELYDAYLQRVVGGLDIGSLRFRNRLLNDFYVLQRICTHPLSLKIHLEEKESEAFVESEETQSEVAPTSDDDQANELNVRKKKSKAGASGGENDGGSGRVSSPVEDHLWWRGLVSNEEYNRFDLSGKIFVLMDLLWRCEQVGDKILVFSQSLITLSVIEEFLRFYPTFVEQFHSTTEEDIAHARKRRSMGFQWKFGHDYLRVDGSTNPQTRKQYMKMFNDEKRPRCRLFLIATRAGGIGTDLVGANRVVIFDMSWNPANDVQAIFRAYRYGQTKPVFIYRFVAQGTMEGVIYDRQVIKQSLALRVVDEKQVERHFNARDLEELYHPRYRDAAPKEVVAMPAVPQDHILGDLLLDQKKWLLTYHEHDSLLQNKEDETLTEEEKETAWNEYKAEREGRRNFTNVPPLTACILSVPEIQTCINYGNGLIIRSSHNPTKTMEQICESWLAQDPTYVSEPHRLLKKLQDLVQKIAVAAQKDAERNDAVSRTQEPVLYRLFHDQSIAGNATPVSPSQPQFRLPTSGNDYGTQIRNGLSYMLGQMRARGWPNGNGQTRFPAYPDSGNVHPGLSNGSNE